ncbi:MAG TPA: glycosyltransferase [Gemmatimonadaceae bacterium]|nr:glycosyltransferase [Gemmatimonadaceae bacterium]
MVRDSGRVLTGARRRVVVLTEDSKPALGGIAEYLHQLALALSATHDIVIVSSIRGAGRVRPPAGVPVDYREWRWHRSEVRWVGDRIAPIRRVNTLIIRATTAWRVRRYLASLVAGHPDTTVVLGRLSEVTHAWCEACRSLGIPYQAIGYGLEFLEPVHQRGASQRQADVLGARHWFVCSRETGTILAAMGVDRERQTVLTPGVDPATVSPPDGATRRAVRDRLGLGAAPFLFTICMLRARKGVDVSIRAFASVADDYPTLKYVIAGGGPEEPALRRLAREAGVGDRVVFAGPVDDATRNALFAECEGFVMANRRLLQDVEGFGIVFLEAALHGKPTIGGRNGGVPDAIADGETGWLADTEDSPDDVARAMRCLLDDPERGRAFGARGRERALRDFNWPSRARTFASTIDELAQRARPTPFDNVPVTAEARVFTGRLRLAASHLRGLAADGRLPSALRRGPAPEDFGAAAAALRSWVHRAFEAGGGEGASASYHPVRGWAPPYPEITGYFIPTLIARGDDTLALRAGHWLASTRLANGAICRKQWFKGNVTPSVFNTGQVIDGWCTLAERTGEPLWRDLARAAADWLLANQQQDGSWLRWTYNQLAQTYYTRVAGALARLSVLLDERRYAEAARRNASWAVRLQAPDGWIHRAGFAEGEAPTTHTIGYVIEGWVMTGLALRDNRYIEAADRAARPLRQSFERKGYLAGRFRTGWRIAAGWRCVTGDAQVGLVWRALAAATGDTRYLEAARLIADQVRRTIEVRGDWPEISGAVPGSWPRWGDYDSYGYPTHAAKFALDLLTGLGA